MLVRPDAVDGEYGRILEFFPPGNTGPPEHYHPTDVERFEVVEGDQRTLTAGDEITVPPDASHTYRNESAELVANVGEARPPAQFEAVVTTVFGLAHEGKVGDEGARPFCT